MTAEERRRAIIAEVVKMGVLIALVVGVWVLQVEHVMAQRQGCERAKADRTANATGWRIAEQARRDDGQVDVADRYARIAAGLEARSRIDCAEAFPLLSLPG